MSLPKTLITVTRQTNNQAEGEKPISTITTILDTQLRRVVIVPNSPQNPYGNVQVNAQAEYLVYFQKGDPLIKIGDKITCTFTDGSIRELVVKILKPMTLVIQGKYLEAWCDSSSK